MAGTGRFHGRPGPPACGGGTRRGLSDPALGRSGGGLTSLAYDGLGRPLALVVTGGNVNGCTRITAVIEAIRVPRTGPGRPRTRPDHVLGDKGYSSKAIRAWFGRKGISHTIPKRADQAGNRARRGSRGGHPPGFDREVYKQRNVVGRCFNRLKR
ncbi:transposase [Streptomyces clavifer]|uniref:transposase n=1 Tax=Streptomyces clavifer TaxID=68188 RepID=UPI0036C5344B